MERLRSLGPLRLVRLERPEILAGQPPVLEPLQLTIFRDEPVVEDAVATLLHAFESLSGTPQMAAAWPNVVNQVRAPRPEQRRGAPAELYRPDVVRALRALMPSAEDMTRRRGGREPGRGDKSAAQIAADRKRIVLERVFGRLLAAADLRLGVTTGGPEAELHENPAIQRYVEGHLVESYLANRAALLAAFGALEVGTATALARANAFYRDMIVLGTFLGQKALVHQDMKAALDRAARLLTDPERAALAREITSLGGTEIRPNTNNPVELSRHSFGAAIDINPERNPNVRDFPTRFIEEVTGADLLHTTTGQPKADLFDLGAMVENLLFGRKDPALREIEHLLRVSNQLVGIFRDDASLAAGMVAVQNRLTGPQSPIAPATLLTAVRAARDEGPHVRWQYQDPKVKLSPKSPVGVKHEALADMLFPGTVRPETLDQVSRKQRIIALLIQMADVYQRSFPPVGHKGGAPGGGGQRRITPEATPPSGEGALPQLVAHGFVNLPSRVISALRAPDGGNLQWLGVGEHVHDFMHFELKQRPKLY